MSKEIGELIKDYFSSNLHGWEEVPDEDLWEDGELSEKQVTKKVLDKLFYTGEWKLIRRSNDTK